MGLALAARQLVVEARYIPSGSMLPGLQIQDRLLVEKLSYRGRSTKRGEIVVFHSPYKWNPIMKIGQKYNPIHCLPAAIPLVNQIPEISQSRQACDAWIKRVVAVSGDHVVVNPKGEVTINGTKLIEPYVQNYCKLDQFSTGCPTIDQVVPKRKVLALGDNRSNSTDGRYWGFLPEEEIIGRAFWRFWPLGTAGDLKSNDPLKPQKPSSDPAQG
jgi:signal peptidase I